MSLAGVDVSSFQGTPRDWLPVAGDIAFGGVKITEYNAGAQKYANPDAPADWAALKAAGHGRIAYLFGHPAAPPKATADWFFSVLEPLGLEDGDAIALDHEVNDGLSPGAAAEWASVVLGLLGEHAGRKPLLYTFRAFAEEGNCAGLGPWPLWLADPSSPAGHPSVPAPWTGWAIHQWKITGPIDRDVANYPDLGAMRAALGRTVPKVTIRSWKSDGHLTLAEVATQEFGTGVSTVLRVTANRGLYPPALAAYLDDVFTGKTAVTAPVPPGITLWGPVS